MPVIQESYTARLQEQGIAVIGVTQFRTTAEQAREFAEEHSLTFPSIYDGEAAIAQQYQVDGVPSYVLLDRQGRIAFRSSGARGVPLLENWLDQLLAES